ncbi:chlorophyll synthesis pathway protein BchC [Microbacterium awajiense]|uniref:Chlorophyll synthesis pathway protein BchC n=1 Tax=Microbacterium awajiense TaxID=415214 RepID=A0ABP7AU86_9MICO
MPYTALAIVAEAPSTLTLTTVDLPEMRPDQVVIRTSLSGFSTGTDRWVMSGRFEWGGFSFPLIPGYQTVGTVVAVGAEVTRVAAGQKVVAIVARTPGAIASAWGCHASMIVSDESNVFDASGVPEISAAFIVSAQVGFNAASRLAPGPGGRVCVIGDGIIGASAALAAAARGFTVLLQGRHEERLAPFADSPIETLDARTAPDDALERWHPDAVIDTVQNDSAFAAYINALPRGGQVVYSGHTPDGVKHWGDMAELQQHEIRADFVSGWTPNRLLATLDAMRTGAMDLAPLVTAVASDRDDALALAHSVATGGLSAPAAAIDWSAIGHAPTPGM